MQSYIMWVVVGENNSCNLTHLICCAVIKKIDVVIHTKKIFSFREI